MSQDRYGMSLTTFLAEVSDGETVWGNRVSIPADTAGEYPEVAEAARQAAVNGLLNVAPREVTDKHPIALTAHTEWIRFHEGD